MRCAEPARRSKANLGKNYEFSASKLMRLGLLVLGMGAINNNA